MDFQGIEGYVICSDPRSRSEVFVTETKPLALPMEMASRVEDSFAFPEAIKGADTASNKDEQHSKPCQKHQRKKMSFLSVTRAGYASWVRSESNILSHPVELSQTVERSDGGRREISSSVSVDAPQRI
ncbi:hypothetical protein OIU79_030205 [Salix purpurea]|uniref:Uncharacterized protein n=1 Tax=Salix purpurea TaxID=77065 RepID=A0A9Q0ZWH5_SALPP|nr:hypothetical protein OIU79_030205 [Salix purpurea]